MPAAAAAAAAFTKENSKESSKESSSKEVCDELGEQPVLGSVGLSPQEWPVSDHFER